MSYLIRNIKFKWYGSSDMIHSFDLYSYIWNTSNSRKTCNILQYICSVDWYKSRYRYHWKACELIGNIWHLNKYNSTILRGIIADFRYVLLDYVTSYITYHWCAFDIKTTRINLIWLQISYSTLKFQK